MNVFLVGTFTVALLHTLIPNHWLCFVLVARAHRWNLVKTLMITIFAGICHVAVTIALGIAAMQARKEFLTDDQLNLISFLVLVALGLLYMLLHIFGGGHKHEKDELIKESASATALFLSVIFSPCSAIIPIFLSVAGKGSAMILISCTLLLTTVGTMTILVALSFIGIERLHFGFFDRYEKLLIGIILCAIGITIQIFD